MKDSVRRIVMLCTIVTVGLLFVYVNVTLIQLVLILLLLAIVLPFLLGFVTIAEVRTQLAGMKKSGIIKRLDEMKFFEKSPSKAAAAAPAKPAEKKPATAPTQPEKKEPVQPGIGFGERIKSGITSFTASLSSLGSAIRERSKKGKKVEDINTMLDKTVSEKVAKPTTPAVSPAPAGGGASLPAPGGGAGGAETDPFLSLSSDEFDTGLLDGLEDDTAPVTMPDEAPEAGESAGPSLPAPELSIPAMDGLADAAAAPAADGGLDEFSGLEGSGSMDEEFGDLDNLSLDDVEVDDDETGGGGPAAEVPAPAAEAPAAAAPAAPQDTGSVKTAWIPSDAPQAADQPEDMIGVQSDMASFAGGAGGTDEDLLSSIASDVKTVKKEKDVSLLRELKDFKAPAEDIENELKDMSTMMGIMPKAGEKNKPPANEIK